MMAYCRRFIGVFSLYFLLSACHFDSQLSQATATRNAQAAEINSQLALLYLQLSRPELALQKTLLAAQQAPTNANVWYVKGYVLEKTGQIQAAENAYKHALRLAHASGMAENNYGTFLCRQKKYAEAITYFLLAAKDPNYMYASSAYENAGYCALKMGNNSAATHYFSLAKLIN